MADHQASRRRFLVAAIGAWATLAHGAGVAGMRAALARGRPATQSSAATLAGFARALYPHRNVADGVYAEVVDDIVSAASLDTGLAALLDQGVAALAGDGDFFDLDEATQLEIVTGLQQQPFFEAIRMQVLLRLYSHPQVWELIRYPGSSVEHGGYVERGFDDIDWLPKDDA